MLPNGIKGFYGNMFLERAAISGDPEKVAPKVIDLIEDYINHEYFFEDGEKVQPYELYIGSTSQDFRMRASKHGSNYYYELMVIVYKERSIKRMIQMESLLIDHQFSIISNNVKGGSAGPRANDSDDYKYVYVCFKMK